MYNIQGIAVDAGASIDDGCDITHVVYADTIELDFGHSTGGLHLSLTERAAENIMRVVAVALEDFRQHRAVEGLDGSEPVQNGAHGS